MVRKGKEIREVQQSEHYKASIKEMQRKMEKYYLVGITGRTSFILENLKSTKFKITIGNQLKCSCSPNLYQHCIHTQYALTEIFYLHEENPLCFKNYYTDTQLRYIIANRRIHTNRIQQFLKYTKVHGRKNQVILEAQEEQEDDQDDICAICHMQIVKQDATTSCNTVCFNKFHIDCFSQWALHQQQKNKNVQCPLCRDEKDKDYLMQIKLKTYEMKENANNKKIGLSYQNYCDYCQLKQIQAYENVFKCVQCEDVTMCQGCFDLGHHIRHSFICKRSNDKKWRQCEDRKKKKKIDGEQGLIRMKLPTTRRLTNFLASTLPCYFSRNTRWNIVQCKKLDIKVQELQCIMCNDKQKAFLRKLKCGHFLHHKCLRKRIDKGRLYCKLDGQKFLLGYDSLLKHIQLDRKVKQVVDEQQQLQQQQKDTSETTNFIFNSTVHAEKSTSCDFRNKHYQRNNSVENGKISSRNKSVTSKRKNSHKKNINPE